MVQSSLLAEKISFCFLKTGKYEELTRVARRLFVNVSKKTILSQTD